MFIKINLSNHDSEEIYRMQRNISPIIKLIIINFQSIFIQYKAYIFFKSCIRQSYFHYVSNYRYSHNCPRE